MFQLRDVILSGTTPYITQLAPLDTPLVAGRRAYYVRTGTHNLGAVRLGSVRLSDRLRRK